MNSRCRRVVSGLFAFALGVYLVTAQSGPEALALQKGGGQKGKGKEREKDVPPPNFTLPDSWVKAFHWRNIGPANMSGRITAISVFEADPSTSAIPR